MQVAGGIGAVGNAGEKAIGLRGGQRQRSLRVVCRALNPALERTWLPAHRCDGDLDPPFARNVGATGITRTTPNRLRGQIWRRGVGENFGRRTGKLRRLPLPWALQSSLLSKKAWLVARLPGAGRDPRFAREHRQGEHDSTSPRSRAVASKTKVQDSACPRSGEARTTASVGTSAATAIHDSSQERPAEAQGRMLVSRLAS